MKGLLIENSFEPEVGEMNELFEVEHESLSGKILSQTECCTGHIHRSRKKR